MKSNPEEIRLNQNLSSSTLFHFTDKLEILKSIIMKGFRFSLVSERLPKNGITYFCPAICYCDIPLSLAKYHISWYGGYGIGLNLTKARELKATPVFYIHKDSEPINFSITSKNINLLKENPILPYLKQVRGKVTIENNIGKESFKYKKFYDEKEWRIIDDEYSTQIEICKTFDIVNDKKEKYKLAYKNRNLEFDIQSIEYLILRWEKEISGFIKSIKKSSIKIKTDELDLLISKIITVQKLVKDF